MLYDFSLLFQKVDEIKNDPNCIALLDKVLLQLNRIAHLISSERVNIILKDLYASGLAGHH